LVAAWTPGYMRSTVPAVPAPDPNDGDTVEPMEPGDDAFAPVRRFAELVDGDPAATPLDETALALAAVLRRGVDADEAITQLDAIAADCASPTFDGLRRHLYDTLGFGGDGTVADDPRNSFLDLVLARRAGLPILLATVVIEVGRRIGVSAEGVNMPLHFLVRDPARPDVYLDPVTGRALDDEGVREIFERMAAGRLAWSPRHLRTVPNRHIVIRMLTNLQASYQRRGDRVRLALVARMRASIPELAQEAAAAARLGAVFN
jgi:regulator of sirC expression with transglutaminase-like and TPR domain